MTLNDYQAMAMRTKPQYKDFKEQIDNACLGLVGEVGEVVDIVKKWLYQGHQLDRRRARRHFMVHCAYGRCVGNYNERYRAAKYKEVTRKVS